MELIRIAGRPVVSIGPSATVQDVCALMVSSKVGALVVLDGGALVGIVSERDIVRRVVATGRDTATTRVQDIMTTAVETVTEEATVHAVLERMHKGAFRHVPLVDASGQVLGMLSVRDLLRERIHELDMKNVDLMNFISVDGPGG